MMTSCKPTVAHLIAAIAISIVSFFFTSSHGSSNNPAPIDILVDINNGAYYVEYSIGNPAVKVSGSLNSGSDLIWLPCNSSDFDLTKSSTYTRLPCPSDRCTSLPATTCSPRNTCNYSMTYADESYSSGDFSTDSDVTFGTGPPRNLAFGCDNSNSNSNSNSSSMGGVGLGRGKSSLVQQLGATKFSYCLVPFSSQKTTSGKLSFGDIESEGVSTPLVSGTSQSFYYVSMESITIGKQTVLRFDGDNFIVEIATPMTLLPGPFYGSMIEALKASMPAEKIIDGSEFQSDLCYSDVTSFPRVTVGFKGGVSVEWKAENVFAQMGENKNCIAFGMADDAIYGSYAQANFVVGFDLVANTVNFKPTTC